MPLYEFYCEDCNTIYTFFSRTINTAKAPACPGNGIHHLRKMISPFAVTGKARGGGDVEGSPGTPELPIDESKMARAMETLASEAENIKEDDPRQAANLMRKLSGMTGLKLGDKMEEALTRMEAGDDPESIEAEMGNIDENDLFKTGEASSTTGKGGRKKAPVRDETIYEM